ncbi:lamin tail domain-containing protein, partial [Priestia megaterium]|uniref:lamin tail domain-containing protein n=1 Tax=Priestia megaterium TaxID=1404 RepID=UPI00362FB321
SGTGPKHYALQYRIDNGQWADVPNGSVVVGNANWESGGSLTAALPADADGQALVSLRWLLTSDESARNAAGNNEKMSATGTNRIYNVVISGTVQGDPTEPTEPTDPVTSKPVASKIIFSDTGAVTGLSGAVAGLADVKLYDAQSNLVGGVTANEDGSFQAVVARNFGTQVWVTATEPDKAESSKVEVAIAVTAAPELSLITFNGEAAEIVGLAGAVEANASVVAYWDSQTLAGSIPAEANGSFRLKLTDAGQRTTVQLAAKHPDKLESAKKQLSLAANPQPQEVKPGDVVISQIYVAGGNSGAIFKTKFVELYNTTDHDIDLTGWSVQYAARTGNFG